MLFVEDVEDRFPKLKLDDDADEDAFCRFRTCHPHFLAVVAAVLR